MIGLLDKLEEQVIGAQGIQIEPQPLRSDGPVMNRWQSGSRHCGSEWSVRPEVTGCSPARRLNGWRCDLLCAMVRCFVQLVRGPVAGLNHSTMVPLSLELLRSRFCSSQSEHERRAASPSGHYSSFNNWDDPGYRVY